MKLKQAADTVVKHLMGVEEDENVLIIVDDQSEKIGEVLWQSAKEAGAEALLLKMIERESHGAEPPWVVAHLMREVDVVLAPTSKSLSHTRARREATEAGVRIATMPGITEDVMARTMSADYAKIKDRTERIAAALNEAEEVHVTAPAGTDIHLSLEDREAEPDTGVLDDKGAFGNLPAGEAFAAPLEGTSNGIIVIDGSMSGIGKLSQPLRITVRNGYAEEIEGPEAEQLIDMLDMHGRKARNIAELGIGTNDMAMITGNTLEDEKVMGTVHFALGNNVSMGGTVNVPIHLDGIVTKPTIVVDGKLLMKDGDIVI